MDHSLKSVQKLADIAHARSGDKGNKSNVSVWVYDRRHYGLALAELTPKRLKETFPYLLRGKVEVFELPHLGGFNLVLHESLEGGVNRSLNLDGHGKSWSSLILSLPIKSKIVTH